MKKFFSNLFSKKQQAEETKAQIAAEEQVLDEIYKDPWPQEEYNQEMFDQREPEPYYTNHYKLPNVVKAKNNETTCPQCFKDFVTLKDLHNHVVDEANQRTAPHDKQFWKQHYINLTQVLATSSQVTPESKFFCPIETCNAFSGSQQGLAQHFMDVNQYPGRNQTYHSNERCLHFDKCTFYMKKDYEKKQVHVDLTKVKFMNPLQQFVLAQIDASEQKEAAVKWLWTCKLKSRDSYLMILSFLNTDLTIFELGQNSGNFGRKGQIDRSITNPIKDRNGYVIETDMNLIADAELHVLRHVCSMLAPSGIHFFSQFVYKRYQFLAPVDDRRIIWGVQDKFLGNHQLATAYSRHASQFILRGEQDERSIDPNAFYRTWFEDALGCQCQGYAIKDKLQGKGLKINLKQGWMVIGYFVGGVPRGDFTRIDSMGNIVIKQR